MIYPNPASDLIYFSSANPITDIQIYDAMGRVVIKLPGKTPMEKMDVSNLKNGIYFVDFQSVGSRITKKIQLLH